MSRTVDGTSSILASARVICRLVGRFGVARLSARATPEIAAAAQALAVACLAFDTLDDYPGQIDHSGTIRAGEDTPRAGGI